MFEHRPFGRQLKVEIRGASHATRLSFRLGGFPRGERVDADALRAFMERRAPGRDPLATARREPDEVVFTRGVVDGVTDGSPVEGYIANTDCRPRDYGRNRTVLRPGHADFGQWIEYGAIPTGGGSNSGRLTAAVCAVGGVCLQLLARRGITVRAHLESVHGRTEGHDSEVYLAKQDLDSVGGTVVCEVRGMPAGVGGALFAGLETELSGALFAIPGVKGLEFGNGFAGAKMRGSEYNDAFTCADGRIQTATNRQGGILGGRTSGMPIAFRVAMRPTATIYKPLPSVDVETKEPADCLMTGRHDPCIARRAPPVVEAMTAFVLADALLAAEAAVPRICLTLTGRTLKGDLAQYAAQRYFADWVELRVDLLDEPSRAEAATFPTLVNVPVVLTFRRTRDGGTFDGPESERRAFFLRTLPAAAEAGAPFACVDFEDDLDDPALDAAARAAGTRIIRSRHDLSGPIPDVAAVCRAMRRHEDDIPKIAFMPRTPGDVARLFEEAESFTEFPHILCAMGAMGVSSRAMAVRTHSLLTYASLEGLARLGHFTPRELVRTYRLRSPDAAWSPYGVTGWPLKFTRSPELHNAAFAAEDIDALMVPVPSPTAAEALAFMRTLRMRGLAVTYPHKEAVMALLDAVSADARRIGAVNTVVREADGRLVGHNTDCSGFAAAITAFLGVSSLAGLKVAVVGAGGAARAVVCALKALEAEVCVFNRTPEKGARLAEAFGCASAPLGPETAGRLAACGDLIVQCAAPGGDPERFDPLAFYSFTGREAVYDLVYEPEVTPTLARARAAGCRTQNGFSMLVAQAAAQRRLWLG